LSGEDLIKYLGIVIMLIKNVYEAKETFEDFNGVLDRGRCGIVVERGRLQSWLKMVVGGTSVSGQILSFRV